MDTLRQDLRFALRKLRQYPGFTLVMVLTLGLGIGANTAIFSLVQAVLLEPLPYPNPDELVMVWENKLDLPVTENVACPADYLDWKEQGSVFEDLAGMFYTGGVVTGAEGADRLRLGLVTANYFDVLGVQAALGRTFRPEESEPGKDEVAVLAHSFWQQRFGGDPEILGKTVTVNGTALQVVGVMPEGFEDVQFEPQISGLRSGLMSDRHLWTPLTITDGWHERTGRWLLVLGRMADGVTLPEARSEMATIAARLAAEHEFNRGWTVNVVPLAEEVVGRVRPALLVLLVGVGFVLLIVCANVAHLMMVRATGRRREMAVRSVLGAGRRRLLRQMLTESLVLAALGGGVGVLIGLWAMDALTRLSPGDIPRLGHVALNGPVLAVAAGLALLTAILFGLLPSLEALRHGLTSTLHDGARGSTDRSGRRTRQGLVVAETALAVVLLVAAGLLIRSFRELRGVDPGFDSRQVLAARLTLPSSTYPNAASRIAFHRRLLQRTASIPGVDSAALTVARPLGGGMAPATSFYRADRPAPGQAERPTADIRMVSPGYFRTLAVPVLRGRDFRDSDTADAPPVIIVNRTLADEQWPGEDPIGRQLVVHMDEDDIPRTVIGVVGPVRHGGLNTTPRDKVYYPHEQLHFRSFDLLVRSAMDPAELRGALEAEVKDLDPDLPLYEIGTMDDLVRASVAEERFQTRLITLFAALALTLACIGNYGVLAYSVTRRRAEIGVRMALGADRRQVLRMVLVEGMRLAALGLGVGLLGAVGLTRFLASLLFGVGTLDAATFAAVPLVLAVTTLLACVIPAWRAARLDPMGALRYE